MAATRPPKPRVLFLEVLPTVSGGQQVLLGLLGGDFPFEAHVLLPEAGPLADRLAAAGAICHFSPMKQYSLARKRPAERVRYAAELPRLAWTSARLARALEADLIYANSGRAFPWSALGGLMAGRPVVWHAHNLFADPGTLGLVARSGRLSSVKRILCVCAAARAQYPGLEAKTRVIYNGVDTSGLRPLPEEGRRARAEWDMPAETFVVGVVGDLTPHKGQEVLLEALGRRRPAGEASRAWALLVVGGERPTDESRAYAARLRERAAGLAPGCRVIFTGHRADLAALYNALDVLVVAATGSETTSLALQEAMACGRAVVASRTGGIPELVEHGVNGFLYPPGDPAALAAELAALAADAVARERVGRAARETAARRFDLARMRGEIVEELRGLIRRGPGRG